MGSEYEINHGGGRQAFSALDCTRTAIASWFAIRGDCGKSLFMETLFSSNNGPTVTSDTDSMNGKSDLLVSSNNKVLFVFSND